jgi:hypothetical protein
MTQTLLYERQEENYRSWIRQNSELTEFWRIQLRIVANFNCSSRYRNGASRRGIGMAFASLIDLHTNSARTSPFQSY